MNREFVKDVEKGFTERGFAVENIYLSNRYNATSVVRQRRAEGVRSVIYLDRRCQRWELINLSSFYINDRITGSFSEIF